MRRAGPGLLLVAVAILPAMLPVSAAGNEVSVMRALFPEPRSDAASGHDGRFLYVVGGQGNSSLAYSDVLRYDPLTDGFTRMGARLPWGWQSGVGVYHGGSVWLFGGFRDFPDNSIVAQREVIRYDVAGDRFELRSAQVPDTVLLNRPVAAAGAIWLLHERGIHRYDPTNDTMRQVGATLEHPRQGANLVWDGADSIYIIGGARRRTNEPDNVLVYKISEDKVVARSASFFVSSASAHLHGGGIFVVSGMRSKWGMQSPADRVEDPKVFRYNISGDVFEEWSPILPFGMWSAHALKRGDEISLAGGWWNYGSDNNPIRKVVRVNLSAAHALRPDLEVGVDLQGTLLDGDPVTFLPRITYSRIDSVPQVVHRYYLDGVLYAESTGVSSPSLPSWTATPGIHTFRAIVDATGLLAEENESNNDVTRTFTVRTFCDTKGPDAGGYVCDRAPYAWLEPPSGGTTVALGDETGARLALPFALPFYGTSVPSVHVSPNGYLQFEGASNRTCCAGALLPDPAAPNALLAAYWEDLDPSSGVVRHGTLDLGDRRAFVVAFEGVPHCCAGTKRASFQAQLFEDGLLRVAYRDAPSDGGVHALGVEAPNGTGLRYALRDVSLLESTIEYRPPPAADLRVASATVGAPTAGRNATFTAVVANRGTATAPASTVRFVVGDTALGNVALAALAPGAARTVASDPWTAAPGHHTLVVTVDPEGVLPEPIERNNRHEVAFDVEAPPAPPPPNQPPVAGILVEPASPVANETVVLTSSSSDPDGSIGSWTWTLDGAPLGTGPSIQHVFPREGTFAIDLDVSDDRGASASARRTLRVLAPPAPAPPAPPAPPTREPAPPANAEPSAVIHWNGSAVRVGDPVVFFDGSNDSDGVILSRSWDFGDGNTSDEQAVRHAYARPGAYAVQLRVVDDDGAVGVAVAVVQVVPNEAPSVRPPTLPSSVEVGVPVAFRSVATDADGTIVRWRWSFGDGDMSEERAPDRAFREAGTYTVEVAVWDDDGASATTFATLVVRAPNRPPVLVLAPFTETARVGTPLDFRAAAVDADGRIVAWRWEFGDGNTSSSANATHAYARPGVVEVRVTVGDDRGANATASRSLVVTAGPADGAAPGGSPTPLPLLAVPALLAAARLRRR